MQGAWGGSSGGDHHLYDGEDDNDKDDNENSKNQEKQTKEDEDDESMMHGRRSRPRWRGGQLSWEYRSHLQTHVLGSSNFIARIEVGIQVLI